MEFLSNLKGYPLFQLRGQGYNLYEYLLQQRHQQRHFTCLFYFLVLRFVITLSKHGLCNFSFHIILQRHS